MEPSNKSSKQSKSRSAQAALEFLTTYGWAFLVILVMIGALSYFGVLDPSRFLPDKCIFGTGFGTCADSMASISSGNISIILINGLGKDITVTNVSFSSQGVGSNCPAAYQVCVGNKAGQVNENATNWCNLNASTIWKADAKATLNLPCQVASGDKPKFKVSFQYVELGRSYNHTINGDVQVKVSP